MGEVLSAAYALDQWLKAHAGRLYSSILGSCLVFGIIATLRNLEQAVGGAGGVSTANVTALAGAVVVQVALLINQLAQLHEFRQAVRERRVARREQRSRAKGPRSDPG